MLITISRAVKAGAAVAVLGTLAATGASASGAAADVPRLAGAPSAGAPHVLGTPGTQLWASRYDGTGTNANNAEGVAVSPSGDRVFVTGRSAVSAYVYDYVTTAYDTATGAQLWLARYDGPSNGDDQTDAVVVSPDGATVYVTGRSAGAPGYYEYATVAYDAATGAQLWASRYDAGSSARYSPMSMATSPSRGTVFVTGAVGLFAHSVTVAYDAATGATRWVARTGGAFAVEDFPRSIAASPDGSAVFITGSAEPNGYGYMTIAYNAATGAKLWQKVYLGPSNLPATAAHSVAVSPDGHAVYVTGAGPGTSGGLDYVTIAYSAATGAMLWLAQYNGLSKGADLASSVAVSPAGDTVFVTGQTWGGSTGNDYLTIGYNAATGAKLWQRRVTGPGNKYGDSTDGAVAVKVSPAGGTVYVTGTCLTRYQGQNYVTVAYNAATGAQVWRKRYNGPGNGDDVASSLAVSPTGNEVFVTGSSAGINPGLGYATIAYGR